MGKLIDSEDGVSNGMMTSLLVTLVWLNALFGVAAVESFHRHLDVAYVPPSFVPDSTSPHCKNKEGEEEESIETRQREEN